MLFGLWEGIGSLRALVAYFRAVQSRWSRQTENRRARW
jgi:hypothetical protein